MLQRTYARLPTELLAARLAAEMGLDTGWTDKGGSAATGETGETAAQSGMVPRGGIEPPTRGFSVPLSPSRRVSLSLGKSVKHPSRPVKAGTPKHGHARSLSQLDGSRRQAYDGDDGCPRTGERLGSNGGDAGRSRRPAERLATEPATRSGGGSGLRAPLREHGCFPPALASCRPGSDVARTRLEQAGEQRARSGLAGSPRNADGTDRIARRPQGTRRERRDGGGAHRAKRVTSSAPETTSTGNSPSTGPRPWPGNGGSS